MAKRDVSAAQHMHHLPRDILRPGHLAWVDVGEDLMYCTWVAVSRSAYSLTAAGCSLQIMHTSCLVCLGVACHCGGLVGVCGGSQ